MVEGVGSLSCGSVGRLWVVCCQGHLERVVHATKVCVLTLLFVLGCDHTHAVYRFCLVICFCMQCSQKTSENILTHVDAL